jgi:hypothetical protein
MKKLIAGAAVAAACVLPAGAVAGPAARTDGAVARGGPVKGAQSSWCKGTQGGRGMCTAIFKRQGAYILTWATTQTTVAHY